jgi:23S rRNA pseudouridine1911/1915/1917 synthase
MPAEKKNTIKKNITKKNIIKKNPADGLPTAAPEIIWESNDYLVIDKPAGLAVHGGGNIKELTLVDWLVKKYPKIKKVGDDSSRPGIVHRLDKDVSGLMVIAKSQASFESLKNQFKIREINKEYIALVHGRLDSDEGEINFPIKRASAGYKMAALPLQAADLLSRRHPKDRDRGNIDGVFQAKEALTEFKVIKRFVNYTLVNVKIKTGRTHQIRVHFCAIGHPLVGDDLYGTKKTKSINKKLSLGRVFLMSSRLLFVDLKGEAKEFFRELPADLVAHLPRN